MGLDEFAHLGGARSRRHDHLDATAWKDLDRQSSCPSALAHRKARRRTGLLNFRKQGQLDRCVAHSAYSTDYCLWALAAKPFHVGHRHLAFDAAHISRFADKQLDFAFQDDLALDA